MQDELLTAGNESVSYINKQLIQSNYNRYNVFDKKDLQKILVLKNIEPKESRLQVNTALDDVLVFRQFHQLETF